MGLGVPGVERRRAYAKTNVFRTVSATTVLLLCLAPMAACGGGGGGDDGSPAATGERSEDTAPSSSEAAATRPCSEERHLVAFDFAGMLTVQEEGDVVGQWLNGQAPDPRPAAPELSHAYRERGYEILYVTAAPPDLIVDGEPAPVAVQRWLEDNGFATGEGTQVHGYTGSGDVSTAMLSITDELMRLSGNGVQPDAGYTDDPDRVYPFASGGIPAERIYTIGPDAGVAGTTPIPNDDLQAHLTEVEALPSVCTPG